MYSLGYEWKLCSLYKKKTKKTWRCSCIICMFDMLILGFVDISGRTGKQHQCEDK